jgi:hypothetical protein
MFEMRTFLALFKPKTSRQPLDRQPLRNTKVLWRESATLPSTPEYRTVLRGTLPCADPLSAPFPI